MAGSDVLFVHNNFPSQFGFIASALKKRGDRCAAIGSKSAFSTEVPIRAWTIDRGTGKDVFPLAVRAEADLLRGFSAAHVAKRMSDQGFTPDLIIGHPGWGETLLLSEVYPKARVILHGEYYYRSRGGDYGFDPEFGAVSFAQDLGIPAKNAGLAMAYADADRIVCPTRFQSSFLPKALSGSVRLIHEGVDTNKIKPRADVTLQIPNGPKLDRSTPVITFVNRQFEPLRGYHIFMRALPALMEAVPEAQVVMIGDDQGRGYGLECTDGTWKTRFLNEVKDRIDLKRIHFVGRVAHAWMQDAYNISAAHIYYTYPFVLSWSLLEAMASGCLIIGSDTGPLHDAVTDGVSGRLLDFFDVDALSATMIDACRHPQTYAPMREAARRRVVEEFDRYGVCLPAWLALIDEVLAEGPR